MAWAARSRRLRSRFSARARTSSSDVPGGAFDNSTMTHLLWSRRLHRLRCTARREGPEVISRSGPAALRAPGGPGRTWGGHPCGDTCEGTAMKTISELLDLTGKVAVVTGAGKGIGQGIAYRLAEAGATTIVADVDYPAAMQTAQQIVANGWQGVAWKVDVAAEQEIRELVREVESEFGSLDVLVNNAGIYPSVPVADMSEELFDRVMRVNLRSVFFTTKHAAEVLRRH